MSELMYVSIIIGTIFLFLTLFFVILPLISKGETKNRYQVSKSGVLIFALLLNLFSKKVK